MSIPHPHRHVKPVLKHLSKVGWEIEEVVHVDEWWAKLSWKLTSTKSAFGIKIFITALTDRLADAEGHSHNLIETIRASCKGLDGFYDENSIIADYSVFRGIREGDI